MKKIILVTILLVLTSSVANAASINGDFKGNPIVNVYANGKELEVINTPAIIYNGNTLVPIYMLRQLGAKVLWDQSTHSVHVEFDNKEENVVDILAIMKNIMELGGGGVTITNLSGSLTAITYFPKINNFESDWQYIYTILVNLSNLNTEFIRVEYDELGFIEIRTSDFRRYLKGEINDTELLELWILGGNLTSYPSYTQPNVPSVGKKTTAASDKINELHLYSNDGNTYLGKLTTNKFDSDSIFNEFGTYGSEFSPTSIWNESGVYGSKFSSKSAFNDLAQEPPIIVLNGEIIGYLTTNEFIINGISPYELYRWLEDNGY